MRIEWMALVAATGLLACNTSNDDADMAAGAVKSGYAGHLPGARDTWGITHYESINMGADGRLHGRERFVNDGDEENNFIGADGKGQYKTYHDDVSLAFHEH